MELTQIKSSLEDGLLSFPITDFNEKGEFNPGTYTDRIAWFVGHNVSSVFVAGGTGEFFSLSANEYQQIITIAVKTVAGRVPVISSVGRSIPEAIAFAKMAEQSAIDALLLFHLISPSVRRMVCMNTLKQLFKIPHCLLSIITVAMEFYQQTTLKN
jgi:5-dehydro-4-deoxyglucarate dehydratase